MRLSRRRPKAIRTVPPGSTRRFAPSHCSSFIGEARELHERMYCARGDMENRIEEQQRAPFADRTSGAKWWTNPHRVLLAASADTVLETIRRTVLRGTYVARTSPHRSAPAAQDRRGCHPKYPHPGGSTVELVPGPGGADCSCNGSPLDSAAGNVHARKTTPDPATERRAALYCAFAAQDIQMDPS